MKPFIVCPNCGNPSLDVNYETVKHFIKSNIDNKLNWGLCINPNCEVSYHSSNNIFYKSDLLIPIWFKNNGKEVPICYCSNLTRGEIESAVKNGNSTIDEVQEYANKNITGNCKTMNPTGRCCREAFIHTIKMFSKPNENQNNDNKKCCWE